MEISESDQPTWISGLIAVQAAVDGGNRHIHRILIQNDRLDSATAKLQQSARAGGIPFDRVDNSEILKYMGGDQHGGAIAEVGPRHFLTLSNLLELSASPAIFMIDGVEDPYNLGQAIRSLYAAGVTGLVLRPRDWLLNGEIVMRSSAGASELMPIATAESAEAAADFFRTQGLAILAATQSDATFMGEVDMVGAFFLAVGGEKRGLSKAFQRAADARVAIPYGRPFDAALGTAAAAGILGYEMLRQRDESAEQG